MVAIIDGFGEYGWNYTGFQVLREIDTFMEPAFHVTLRCKVLFTKKRRAGLWPWPVESLLL